MPPVSPCLLRSDGRCGLIAFSLREQCPRGASGLVGDGNCHQADRFALQQRSDPSARSGGGGWRPPCGRGGADNQQAAQAPLGPE